MYQPRGVRGELDEHGQPGDDALKSEEGFVELENGFKVWYQRLGDTIIGNLREWDRIERLSEIRVPTLITVGHYDELTPACAETLRAGIPDSRLVVFENSSHLAHVEEEARYLEVVRDFLDGS